MSKAAKGGNEPYLDGTAATSSAARRGAVTKRSEGTIGLSRASAHTLHTTTKASIFIYYSTTINCIDFKFELKLAYIYAKLLQTKFIAIGAAAP